MINSVFNVISWLSETIWTYFALWLLVGSAVGMFFYLRLYRLFRLSVVRQVFKSEEGPAEQKRAIRPFHAFCISLASCVGTGNLAGVASAIYLGGPGAIFWMCVMAVFASALSFAECSLAQLYKRKGPDSYFGGPAYYIAQGMKLAPLGALFAVATVFNQGMMSHIVQTKVMCDAVGAALNLDGRMTAYVITAAFVMIAFGGVKRVARFSSIIVPVMSVGYVLIAFYVLIVNFERVPGVLAMVWRSAFELREFAGGAVGAAILHGVRRGIFTNEAGEGSSPCAAATASVSHPAKQGMVHVLGVFTDTLLICSCTAVLIFLSGVDWRAEDGIILAGHAMEVHLGPFGRWFLTAAILMFAFSTVVGNYFYGESNVRHLTRSGVWLWCYRAAATVMVLVGGFVTLGQAWSAVDLAVALMVILNLYALWMMRGKVRVILEDFLAACRKGCRVRFSPSVFPDEKFEAWEDQDETVSTR